MSSRKAAPAKKRTPREPKKQRSELAKPTPWANAPADTTELAGFVYLIEHIQSGKKYIGRKYFHAHTRVKVKGKTRRKRKVKESDWRHYKSSCVKLKEDIELYGVGAFTFTILSTHDTRAKCNYEEVKQQFVREVLERKLTNGENEFYNDQILSRYYRSKE